MNSKENSIQYFLPRSDSEDDDSDDDNTSDSESSSEAPPIQKTNRNIPSTTRKFSKDSISDQQIARLSSNRINDDHRKKEQSSLQFSNKFRKGEIHKSRQTDIHGIEDPTLLRKRSPPRLSIPADVYQGFDHQIEANKDSLKIFKTILKATSISQNFIELPFKISRTIIPSTEISTNLSSRLETKKANSMTIPPSPTLPERTLSAPSKLDPLTSNQRQETFIMDHQTAAYLTKTDNLHDSPFDYNDFEFHELHQYLSELTRNIAESGARPLHISTGLIVDAKHAIGMLSDLVEVLFYQSFDGRDYLFKGSLGKHINNLVACLKEAVHLKDHHFLESALLKINTGLKELANISLRAHRNETILAVPSVLNIPPSFLLLLASSSGWLKSQFRLRMLRNIRERVASLLDIHSVCLSLVLAIDIEKEAHRAYPSFDSCSKYVGLVRELLAEIKVSSS